jgi:hypothetical protein
MSLTAINVTGQPVCCHGVARLDERSAHAGDENIRIEDMVRYSKLWGCCSVEDEVSISEILKLGLKQSRIERVM